MTTEDNYNKKLNPYQYFIQIQLEYLSIAIRSKIFFTPKNKQYWEDIKVKKRIKIEEFAQSNHLKTVFSDAELRQEIETIFYDHGIPNFTYRDLDNEVKQKPFDLLAYYKTGEEISFIADEGIQAIGKIHNYTLNSNIIKIVYENKIITTTINNCKRILFELY